MTMFKQRTQDLDICRVDVDGSGSTLYFLKSMEENWHLRMQVLSPISYVYMKMGWIIPQTQLTKSEREPKLTNLDVDVYIEEANV